MNYDQVIAKVNRLEQTLDLILSTMAVTEMSPEQTKQLAYEKDRAGKRQSIRERELAAATEYWELKNKLAELEHDYPSLKAK